MRLPRAGKSQATHILKGDLSRDMESSTPRLEKNSIREACAGGVRSQMYSSVPVNMAQKGLWPNLESVNMSCMVGFSVRSLELVSLLRKGFWLETRSGWTVFCSRPR